MRLLIRGGNVPTGKLQQADRPAGGKSACGWKTWFSLQEVVFEMSLERGVKTRLQGEALGTNQNGALRGKAEAGQVSSAGPWHGGARARACAGRVDTRVTVRKATEGGPPGAKVRALDSFLQRCVSAGKPHPMCSYRDGGRLQEGDAGGRTCTLGAFVTMRTVGQDRGAADTRAGWGRAFGDGPVSAHCRERPGVESGLKAGRTVSCSSPSRSGGETFLPTRSAEVPAGEPWLGTCSKWSQGAGSGRFIGERRGQQGPRCGAGTPPTPASRPTPPGPRDGNGTDSLSPGLGWKERCLHMLTTLSRG